MLQLSVAVSGQVYYSHAATDVPQFVDLLQAITADTSVIAVTDATGWMSEDFGVQSYFSFFEPEPLLVNQPASGTATFEIPFVFGEAFDLELQLFSIASVGVYEVPGGMFSMLADFHNTAVISGISVFDNLENPITAATVFGNGGLDYSQTFTAPAAPGLPPLTAVPEPSTVILLSLGGVGLLHRRAIPRKP
jgi:hypothetical protein